MNTQATLQKLNQMRLYGFERAYKEVVDKVMQQNFTIDELVAHLVEAEYDEKYNRKLERLVKQAAFKQQASIEHINYSNQRGLDKNLILNLQTCDWLKKSRDLIVTGPTGVGKSFVACALGYQACLHEYKVLYTTANKLLDKLMYAKADGTYFKKLEAISKAKLLIIDDFGLRKLDHKQCNIMLDIIDDRHGKTSTIMSSQLPVSSWYDCFSEPTMADAILDRIINASYRIELLGESMRKILKNN